MKFELLLQQRSAAEDKVYSVEERSMLTHETATDYYLSAQEAIKSAEKAWQSLDQSARQDFEISVHQGFVEEQSDGRERFIVEKKLFKAYKKIYIAEDFGRRFLKARTEYYMTARDLTKENAAAQARKDLYSAYEIQPKTAYGMFAGFSYEPAEAIPCAPVEG